MRRLLPLFAILLLSGAPSVAKADFNPIFMALGAAKLPGVAFDAVGAARIAPHLELFEGEALGNAARASFASNLVTLGLHTGSIAAFFVGAFVDEDWEEVMAPVFLFNAAADLSIAVMGLVTGVDLLLQRNAAGIEDTELGVAATWSAAVNLTMGGFGALWFLPMTIGGLIGASDAFSMAPSQGPVRALAVVPQPSGVLVVGRF